MRGLLMKDFLLVKKQYGKIMLAVVAFYFVLAFLNFKEPGAHYMFGAVLTLCFSIMPVSVFALDDGVKWDRYALCAVPERRAVVRSRYLFTGLLLCCGVALSVLFITVVGVFTRQLSFPELLDSVGEFLFLGVLLCSLMLPFIYKFGPEKARYIILGAALVPLGLSYLLKALGGRLPDLSAWTSPIPLTPLLAAVCAFISYQCSMHIYLRKPID